MQSLEKLQNNQPIQSHLLEAFEEQDILQCICPGNIHTSSTDGQCKFKGEGGGWEKRKVLKKSRVVCGGPEGGGVRG